MATKRLKEKIRNHSNSENFGCELIQLLSKIEDKSLQDSIVKAINTIPIRVNCLKCQALNMLHFEIVENSLSYHVNDVDVDVGADDDNPKKRKFDEVAHTETINVENTSVVLEKPKKKRKRKIYEPKGVKTSATAHLLEQQQKKQTQLIQQNHNIPIIPKIIQPSESEDILDTNLELGCPDAICQEVKQDGYLPLHIAIVNNHSVQFFKSLAYWKKQKVDLNNYDLLLTDDDKDCLQLAVLHDSLPDIIRHLLDADFSTETFDEQYNSIIHLAILSDIQMVSFDHLLKKIRWEILLERNTAGFTPLHLAIHENRFLHAEQILNIMDFYFNKKIDYEYKHNIYVPDSKQIDQFSKYYENICMNLMKPTKPISYQKQQLLNAVEPCSGRTALAVSIQYKLDHISFLLLAHLADPTIKNYFGISPISYFSEFCKVNELNLKVDTAMVNVKKILYPNIDVNRNETSLSDTN